MTEEHEHLREHEHEDKHNGHSHDLKSKSKRRVLVVFILTVGFMVIEAVGGWWSGSLALLGDAGHMLTDAGALALALFAFRLSDTPPSPERSFGLHRAEILAALSNGAVLLVVAVLIVREGVHRLMVPPEIKSGGMLVIAVIGLVVNMLGAYILLGGDRENLNLRGALFHVAGDTLGSIGAIAAALTIIFTGWTKIDPLVSFVIAGIIIIGALKLMGDAVHIFLEATPRNIKLMEVEQAMLEHERVESVHDLHIWTITSGFVSLSAHVVLNCPDGDDIAISDTDTILEELGGILENRFDITHSTIQIEREACSAPYCDTCNGGVEAECSLDKA